MKISNLPKTNKSKNTDLLTIVQGTSTKVISTKDFTKSLNNAILKLSSEVKSLRSTINKKSLSRDNPVLSKNLVVPSPVVNNHATNKAYVDSETSNRIKRDGSSKIIAPLTYDKEFTFNAKDLITKEYADDLLKTTLKTIEVLSSEMLPAASAGDVFIANKEYLTFAEDGPDLQNGDVLICLRDSDGGTFGAAGSQFAILNTNIVTATEQEAGIVKLASDEDLSNLSSTSNVITPQKYKNYLDASSLYNRNLVDFSAYQAVELDRGILAVDSRRNAVTVTLPAIPSLAFPKLFKITIKDEFGTASTKPITVTGVGATIDKKTNIVLTNDYQAVTIYNDGLNYYVESNTHGATGAGRIYQATVFPKTPTGTSEETIYSYAIDLSQFDIGQGFKIESTGLFAATSNNKDIKFVVGGNDTLVTTTAAPNNKRYIASLTVIRDPKYFTAYGTLISGTAIDTIYNTYTLSLDYTSTITVAVAATAPSAASDITVYSFSLETLK